MRKLSLFIMVAGMLVANVLCAQTTLKSVKSLEGAYFNSSCGDDRLGGSKIGFLDKDILLQVEQKSDSLSAEEPLYKVILSSNRYAFIPKEMVADTLVADSTAFVPCASSSVRAFNEGGYDRVKIALPAKRPYIVRESSSPRQMIIELFGVQNNSNWIVQQLNLKSVENIEAVQSDSDVLTLIVNLKSKTSWGYSVKYDETTLVVDIKDTPELTLKGMVVGIDAGHGGQQSRGAIARRSKIAEKDLNLSMARMLKAELEAKGARVVMSRSDDSGVTMSDRKQIFLDNNVDMMISIHCNAGGGTAHGTSTYYKHIQNRELAKSILERLVELDGVDMFGLVGNFNFSLNAPTEYPAVLVETLFLSYGPDEELIINPKFQKSMMKKVREGIEDYLKYCKKLEK